VLYSKQVCAGSASGSYTELVDGPRYSSQAPMYDNSEAAPSVVDKNSYVEQPHRPTSKVEKAAVEKVPVEPVKLSRDVTRRVPITVSSSYFQIT
jgi:hypothetical protein